KAPRRIGSPAGDAQGGRSPVKLLTCCLRGWLRRRNRVILNMAAQAETTVNRFYSLDGDMALQAEERFRGAETFARNNNLALQAFTLFEWFLRDAIESFAAEVFGRALNRHHFSLPP